uniref:ORF10 n=1 Tax=Physarum polycephalum TaxID=5791 RepID=Q9MJ72_PHYPO|nr:hypothetical protein PhpooMp11 [Physarum polycephalum]BAB08090.1 unnamed protein product [Physarum polycephalum]
MFFKLSIIFYLRYLYLGQNFMLYKSENSIIYLSSFSRLLFMSILIIIVIYNFYKLLDIIFFDEILKLYLYFFRHKFNDKMRLFVIAYSIRNIWGPIYLFFDSICNFTPIPDEYYYDDHYIYDWIYNYTFVTKLSLNLFIYQNTFMIHLFFKCSKKMFRLLYIHLHFDAFGKYLHILLLSIVIIYEIIHTNMYYTYYMLFITYIINVIYKYYIFEKKKDFMFDGLLNKNFYNVQYFIFANNKSTLNMKTNIDYLYFMEKLKEETTIKYILNDFEQVPEELVNKQINQMYLRFSIILILLFMTIFLYDVIRYSIIIKILNYNIYSFFILLPLIFILYSATKIFTLSNTAEIDDFTEYVFNKKFNIISWILISIHYLYF